jgi:hypothetical protein
VAPIRLNRHPRDGAFVCTGMSIELLPDETPQPITATLMRALPVARLVSAARAKRFEEAGGCLVDAYDGGQDISPEVVESLRPGTERWTERSPGRPVVLNEPLYSEVAQIYSSALSAGTSPLVAVQRRWMVSRPTASRYVAAARSHGLLPPTVRGRARGNGPLIPGKTNTKGISR